MNRKKIIATIAFFIALLMVEGIDAAEQYTLGPEFKDVTIDIGMLNSGKNQSVHLAVG